MDLKAILCRTEWSLFQVHNTKHMQVIIFIMNFKGLTQRLCLNCFRTNISWLEVASD